MKINTVPALYRMEVAVKMAMELNAGDPEWLYVIDHDPKGTGLCRIAIHEYETFEFIAFWTGE